MKTTLPTITVAVLLFLTGSAMAAPSDRECLLVGGMAEEVAKLRSNGQTEAQTLKGTAWDAKTKGEKGTLERQRFVIAYVYTMQYAPADAKKMAYLKCMAGQL